MRAPRRRVRLPAPPATPVQRMARQAQHATAEALAAGDTGPGHLAAAEAIRFMNLIAAAPARGLPDVMAKLGLLVRELAGEAEYGSDDIAAMRVNLAAGALADLAVLGGALADLAVLGGALADLAVLGGAPAPVAGRVP